MVYFINLYNIFFFFIFCIINNNAYFLSNKNDLSIIDPNHLDKIYESCNITNIIFCSIAEAIKYSFNLIKKEFKSYPLNCTDIICLQYKNVYTPDAICEDVEAILEDQENNDGKYLVSFSNCKVSILGALSVKNETDTIMEYDQFLSEMYFDKINFYQNVRSTKGELNITFKYDETFINTFNYNKTDPIFDNNDTNLIEQMNNILKDILENYIYVWESKIEIDENTQLLQITYLNQIINRFSKEYSIIKYDTYVDNNIITYIAYNEIKYNSFINLKNMFFIPNFNITFEYALNYNITYNEGNFTIKNISISRNNPDYDYFGNITNKYAQFNVPENDSILIWNIINDDFCNCFKKYK